MGTIVRRNKKHWSTGTAVMQSLAALIFFAASLVAEYASTAYATKSASNSVTDIILSNTPAMDVSIFYVYGLVCLIVFITLLCLANPKQLPFMLSSLALFIFIRSGFVSLTHIATFPVQPPENFGATMQRIFFGSDLFFSGHTGVPYLFALIFWRDLALRYVFLVWSVFFAAVVLLGHLHYSIDVAAAYFITYTIFVIAQRLFSSAHAMFLADEREVISAAA